MAHFYVDYTLIEVTRRRVTVEAETAEEARQLVEEYEADLSDNWQIESIRYEVDAVEVTGKLSED